MITFSSSKGENRSARARKSTKHVAVKRKKSSHTTTCKLKHVPATTVFLDNEQVHTCEL